MKLHSLRIQGLRKHFDITIKFGSSTFLIGANNIGKSTVFKALEYLLTDIKKLMQTMSSLVSLIPKTPVM